MFTDSDWYRFVGILIFIGIVIGAILFLGVPWLWSVVKPWIHLISV